MMEYTHTRKKRPIEAPAMSPNRIINPITPELKPALKLQLTVNTKCTVRTINVPPPF